MRSDRLRVSRRWSGWLLAMPREPVGDIAVERPVQAPVLAAQCHSVAGDRGLEAAFHPVDGFLPPEADISAGA